MFPFLPQDLRGRCLGSLVGQHLNRCGVAVLVSHTRLSPGFVCVCARTDGHSVSASWGGCRSPFTHDSSRIGEGDQTAPILSRLDCSALFESRERCLSGQQKLLVPDLVKYLPGDVI